MNCPRCGSEMCMDEHRKIPLLMCYSCGYIEGRVSDDSFEADLETNFKHMRELNFNEQVAFVSPGLGIDENRLRDWLVAPYRG